MRTFAPKAGRLSRRCPPSLAIPKHPLAAGTTDAVGGASETPLIRRLASQAFPDRSQRSAALGALRGAMRSVGTAPARVPQMVADVLRSPGRPLEPSVREEMEVRFGHDFSRVRVHTDTRAADSARAVNALAYT